MTLRQAHNCLQHAVKAQREREWGSTADFEREIAPLIDRMRQTFERQDEALLAMHPSAPSAEERRRLNDEWEGVS